MDRSNRNILSAMSPMKAFKFESWRIKKEILEEEAENLNDSVPSDDLTREDVLYDSLGKNTMYLRNKYVDVSPTSSLQSGKFDSSTTSPEDSFMSMKSFGSLKAQATNDNSLEDDGTNSSFLIDSTMLDYCLFSLTLKARLLKLLLMEMAEIRKKLLLMEMVEIRKKLLLLMEMAEIRHNEDCDLLFVGGKNIFSQHSPSD